MHPWLSIGLLWQLVLLLNYWSTGSDFFWKEDDWNCLPQSSIFNNNISVFLYSSCTPAWDAPEMPTVGVTKSPFCNSNCRHLKECSRPSGGLWLRIYDGHFSFHMCCVPMWWMDFMSAPCTSADMVWISMFAHFTCWHTMLNMKDINKGLFYLT